MKSISAKKIFSIIGIVFGSVTAFVGAVFGVMAAMGKFKTPIVYPAELIFLNNDQIVIEKETYDASLENDVTIDIYSLELQGNNSGSEHKVNQKNCYVWFYNNVGANLITLCDRTGKPLQKDENNRYQVQCNEPIYYMINKIADDAQTDGKVMLMARSENNKVQAQVPLTFWIDRKVEGVFVDTDLESQIPTRDPNTQTSRQEITVGVDIGFDFVYSIDTPLSIKPISKESAKEIELYYVATGYSTDYIRVTEDNVNDTTSPLNSILTFKDGVYTFKSNKAGEHTFQIAVFPTYQAKLDYEASISGQTIDNPNYHRATHMTQTSLKVTVENIDVSEVGIMGTNVVLDLYSQKNYITLDGISGIAEAKDNNIELYMKKGTGANVVSDYSRFDEVTMGLMSNLDEAWAEKTPVFVTQTAEGELEWTYEDSLAGMNVATTVSLSENWQIVNYLYAEGDEHQTNKYFCNNGVAVYNTETEELKVLKAGSYLDFYIQDAENNYKLASFDYEANLVPGSQGRSKTWQIISKEIPKLEEGENLELRVLVVNNHGQFELEKFFVGIDVSISEVLIDYSIENYNVDLDITFENETADYAAIDFEDLISINTGSYNSSVLVVEDKGEDAKYIVKTIPSIKFVVDNKTYVLVGEYLESENLFVNKVVVNDNVSSLNKSCDLYVLQLKNEYKQTTSDIITLLYNKDINAGYEDGLENLLARQIINNESIKINSKYVLNKDILDFKYYDVYSTNEEECENTKFNGTNYTVYENTNNHKIVLTSVNKEMLVRIVEFYGIKAETIDTFFKVNYPDALDITSVEPEKINEEYTGNLILSYNANKCLSDDSLVIKITFEGIGTPVELDGLLILSGSPSQIKLNAVQDAGDEHSIVLSTSRVEAQYGDDFLQVIVSYNGGYEYTFNLNGTYTIDSEVNIFNNSISNPNDVGFQAYEDKDQVLPIRYSSFDSAIFNTSKLFDEDGNPSRTDLVETSGETVLTIEIGETTRYLKVKSIASNFSLNSCGDRNLFEIKDGNSSSFNINNKIFTGQNGLEKMISLSYESNDITLSAANLVYIDNLKCVTYGDGTLITLGNKSEGWELKKSVDDETPILSVKDNGNGWEFVKINPHVSLTISFDVSTIVGSKTITLTFSSDVNVSVNEYWTENKVFYAETQVLLFSNSSDAAVFTSEKTLTFTVNGSDTYISGNTLSVQNSHIGAITIEVYYSGEKIHTFTDFVVKANVIASVLKDGEGDKKFESETNYAVNKVYSLQRYNTTIVYGESSSNLYGDANLQSITDFSSLVISVDSEQNSNPELTWNGELSVGEMDVLGVEKTRTIRLIYNNRYIVSTDSIKVENCHKIVLDEKVGTTFKALRVYDSMFASVSGFYVSNISATGLTFANPEESFKILTPITEEQDFEVVLTFINADSKVLTYTTTITVLPYSPEENKNQEVAYSEAKYDLFSERYNEDDIDENVESLVVSAIKNEKGEDITAQIISGEFAESGYTKGQTGANCEINFNKINGDYVDIKVEYTITFTNGLYYSYLCDLRIENRQTIELSYPESDLTISSGTYKFLTGFEQDGAFLSNNEYSAEGIYSFTNPTYAYEPIVLYPDKAQVLTFDYDDVKKINRAVVLDKQNPEATTDKTLTISLIGYQDKHPGLSDYSTRVDAKYDTNTVSLPLAIQGMSGTLIFKLETVSGNVGYYFIYVYCVGTSSKINEENSLKVVAYQDDKTYPNATENVATIAINQNTTYASILTELGNTNRILYSDAQLGDIKFDDVFGRTYDVKTTSLYLYNGTYTGETARNPFNYNGKQWEKLVLTSENGSEIDKITLDEHFNTITLGLLYQSGIEMYVYGTITIYVQPTTNVSANGLSYVVPNGEFTKAIGANETAIDCSFGTGWTAKIISIDGKDYESSAEKGYIYVSGSSVSLDQRVENDTIIRVEYSLDGTIVYVNYTYAAIILPEGGKVTVGQFVDNGENSYFNNKIDLRSSKIYFDETSYNKYFFGTYDSNYSLYIETTEIIDGNKTEGISRNGSVLTFDQSTAEYEIDVTIKYLNFGDVSTSRKFTFVVLAGLAYTVTDDTQSGESTSRARSTDFAPDYTSQVGSTLDITKGNNENLYYYTIGGLTIYTNEDSKLNLTFDDCSYVLNSGNVLNDDESIQVEETKTLEFTHSAKTKPLTMTIDISTASGGYDPRQFYINVVQTYYQLQATYLVAGADHENVLFNTQIEDLHSTLLGNQTTRFALLGTEIDATTQEHNVVNNANLIDMGFGIHGNPNYIEFTCANATIREFGSEQKTKGIVFDIVKNTDAEVYLNNLAGMEANTVYYTYQIMEGPAVDGLDYTESNGEYAQSENYISFLMNDSDKVDKKYQSKKFKIGSMLDQKNLTIFDISINGTKLSKETNYSDFKIEGSTSNKVGEYFDAIQYTFTLDDYDGHTFYLTYDRKENNIDLIVERTAGKAKSSNIIFTIDIAGVNGYDDSGKGTVVNGLTIVLSNYQITGKYEDTTDLSVYAGDTITLRDKINVVDNAEGTGSDKITFELTDSEYTVDGTRYYIYGDDADKNKNELFAFDGTLIETRAVGSNVDADIMFIAKIEIDGKVYKLKTVAYNLQIQLNLQFVVNGGNLYDNINADLSTNFVLTTKLDADSDGEFPIATKFVSKQTFDKNAENKYQTDTLTSGNLKEVYYNVLVFDLYRVYSNGVMTNTDLVERTLITVELDSYIESGVLEVTNDGIKFLKDFTGDITLKLSLKTDNGSYTQYWTISVFGIKNIAYAGSGADDAKIDNSGLPFSSYNEINLISDSSDSSGIGILMTNAPTFANSDVRMNMSYQYSINKVSSVNSGEDSATIGMTNKQLFENRNVFYQGGNNDDNVDDEKKKTTNIDATSNAWEIILPSVPGTLTEEQYYVTYKVYVEYLGLTYSDNDLDNEAKVFYLTYLAVNKQKVETYLVNAGTLNEKRSSDINVDNLGSSTELDLFYYKEAFGEYNLIVDAGNVKLSDGTTTYTLNESENQDRYFGESNEFIYDCSTNKLYKTSKSSGNEISGRSVKQDYPDDDSGNVTIYSVFTSKFTNIFEFAEFIGKYLDEECVQLEESETVKPTFKLIHLGDGRYGVDLAEEKPHDNKLFNNEMRANLYLLDGDIKTITVPAYSASNTSGFRLTTSSKITAKTNGGEGIVLSTMFLPRYFAQNTEVENNPVTIDTPIIGVGDPTSATNSNWTSANKAGDTDGITYATISIPKGNNESTIYNVKKVTYTAGTGTLYNLKQDFYYIDREVVVPDYGAVGIEKTLYKVTYIPNASYEDASGNSVNYQIINLPNAVKVWKMDTNGELYADNASNVSKVNNPDPTEFEKNLKESTVKINGVNTKVLAIETSVLDAYKKQNPTKKNYQPITIQLEAEGVKLLCDVEFALAEYVTISKTYSGNDISENLMDLGLYISNGVKLESINSVKYVDELSSGRFMTYDTTGILKLDGEKLATYFNENSAEKYLYITLRLTTTDDSTLDFQICVKNGNLL